MTSDRAGEPALACHAGTLVLYAVETNADASTATATDETWDGEAERAWATSSSATQSSLRGEWQHFKGGRYTVIGEVVADAERLVLYLDEHGRAWLRPLADWQSPMVRADYNGPRFNRLDAR